MKESIRALGIDDSYFKPHTKSTVPLVGVLVRAPNYLEGVLLREITVDGMDATEAILDMLKTPHGRQARVVITQGITFGGFNIIDLERLNEEGEIPIIVVSRKKPDIVAMEDALRKHFSDWEERVRLLKKVGIVEVENKGFPLYIQVVGMDITEAKFILNNFTIRGAIPEPVRMAHIIASALGSGESRGKP